MKRHILITSVFAGALFAGCSAKPEAEAPIAKVEAATSDAINHTESRKKIEANKAILSDFLDAFFTNFDAEATAPFLTDTYIQHNPMVPSGKAPILEFIPALKESGMKITTHRMIAEGDLVVTHNHVENAQIIGHDAVVTFDVFRFENGKVAEHWDNVSAKFPPNPSGRTQFDGTKEITDFDKTDVNKALVVNFVNSVLIGGAHDSADDYISTETYIQHNSDIGDGLEAVKKAWAEMANTGMAVNYETLHYVIAEGNFVFTMSEGFLGEKHMSFYNLFRVQDGKIVEHWDVLEEIPPKEKWAHQNGKF